MSTRTTPSQTAGPYFHIGLSWLGGVTPIGGAAAAGLPAVEIHGSVTDGAGQPVVDALLEIWRPSLAPGAVDGSDAAVVTAAQGFGRAPTDDSGAYRFRVVKPEAPPGQAPHLVVLVFMRGLLKAASTRIYFAGSSENETDPVLQRVPLERRGTLLAQPEGSGQWRFDVRMQGDKETVFFEY